MWNNLESIRKFSKFTVTKNNSQALRRPRTAAVRVTSFKRTSKFINILKAINSTHKHRSKFAHSLSLQSKCSRWQTERQRGLVNSVNFYVRICVKASRKTRQKQGARFVIWISCRVKISIKLRNECSTITIPNCWKS